MPHSPGSPATSASKAGSDDNTTPASNDRMSEAALRKKKNADAQAAFRARRANYIATLEETGAYPRLAATVPILITSS